MLEDFNILKYAVNLQNTKTSRYYSFTLTRGLVRLDISVAPCLFKMKRRNRLNAAYIDLHFALTNRYPLYLLISMYNRLAKKSEQ